MKNDLIYAVVQNIPKGKVLTYGEVAKRAKVNSPRLVGQLLHANPDPAHIPCHRVVSSKGRLAKNYAFGGTKAQAKKLQQEGVKLKNNKIELTHYSFQPR